MDKNNKLYYSPAAFDCACAASIRDLGWQIHDKLQLICKIEKNMLGHAVLVAPEIICWFIANKDHICMHYSYPVHEQTNVSIIA